MQELNPVRLESSAWRAHQRDGLFDLFFAALFLGVALSQLADGLLESASATLGVLAAVQFGGAACLWWARRRITRPRLGVVRFARPRIRRMRAATVVLASFVLFTAALVVLTALAVQRGSSPSGLVSRYTVSAVAGVLVFFPLAAIAYFLDCPRVLVHAALFGGAEFAGTWLERATIVPMPRVITFGAAAVISTAIGAFLLARFLRLPRPQLGRVEDGETSE